MDGGPERQDPTPSFPLATRRDAETGRPSPIHLDRRMDFVPLVDASPGRGHRPQRVRRLRSTPMVAVPVALIVLGSVAIPMTGADHREPPPSLGPPELTSNTGPFEAKEAPSRVEAGGGHADRKDARQRPRRPKKEKRDKKRGPRKATIVLASSRSSTRGKNAATANEVPTHSPAAKRSRSNKKEAGSKGEPPPPPPEATLPLYHLYKEKKNDHYFTSDPADRDDRVARGYVRVGVEGYMFAKPVKSGVLLNTDDATPGYLHGKAQKGFVPLYMLRGYNGYGDLFTTDTGRIPEYEEQGWNNFGIYGYVKPAG